MQTQKSTIANGNGSGGIQSGAAAGTGGSLYQGNVQVDPLYAPQAAQALRMLLDPWPRVSKLAKCKKMYVLTIGNQKCSIIKGNPYNIFLWVLMKLKTLFSFFVIK
jgi:hypothetical protein